MVVAIGVAGVAQLAEARSLGGRQCGFESRRRHYSGDDARMGSTGGWSFGRRAATTAPTVPTRPPVTDTASRAGDTRPVTASPSTTSAIVPGAVPRTVPSRY